MSYSQQQQQQSGSSTSSSSSTLVERAIPFQRHHRQASFLNHRHHPEHHHYHPATSQHHTLRHQRSLPDNSADSWRRVAEAAHRAEVARQEHLILQQQHERLRLRERLGGSSSSSSSSSSGADRDSDMPPSWSDGSGGQQAQQSAGQNSRPSSSAPKDAHQVYLLNCKSCGNFLTDRGMRAVLLLRPHVTLFSTDIMPTNCGPLYPPSRSFASTTTSSTDALIERTCDCLTQTLGCYGCGAQVGYHIVSPCARCTASVSDTQRGSNGHRTVLHCSEISVRPRRYVPGEQGVVCASRPAPHTVLLSPSTASVTHSSTRSTLPSQRQPPLAADAQHRRARAALLRQFERNARNPNSGDAGYNVVQSSNPRIVRIDPDGNFTQPLTEEMLWSLGAGQGGMDLAELELDMEKAEAAARMDEFNDEHHGAHGDRAHGDHWRGRSAAVEAQTPASKSNEASRGARRIERGGLVYWSDLVAGGERAEPLDSDVLLGMPIAGR